jgi:hypothetical protein
MTISLMHLLDADGVSNGHRAESVCSERNAPSDVLCLLTHSAGAILLVVLGAVVIRLLIL